MPFKIQRFERWWTPALAAALFALNAWICWRLFWIGFTPSWSSVEGSFVGLARHLSLHWRDFSWWTIWQCGLPYQNTYVPLFHLAVAIVTSLRHTEAVHAYHLVSGITYSLGGATLFLMVRRFGASRIEALFAGLFFSLFSPSAFLVPEFGVDLGSRFAGRRLQVLTVYGEGPHVSAIALIPIVLLALEYAVRRRTRRAFALAAIAIAVVFLTNVPGTMALALAVFCWLACQPSGSRIAAWKIAAGAALFAYAIACFGDPPSSLATVFGNVGPMHSGFSHSVKTTPYLLPILLATIAATGWALARTRIPLAPRFGALYAVLTSILVLTARQSEKFELLPQAGRLHLEMELGASLVFAWLLWLLYRWRWTRLGVLVISAVAVAAQISNYRWRARIDLVPVNPATRSEYTSARWIDANMHGRRTYATGSTGFWFNAITDTPQVVGCCDQGKTMLILPAAAYLIHAGDTPLKTARAVQWLEVLGAHAVIVNGPKSSDEYKDFQKPERFANFLTPLHEELGDTIYAVPQITTSMAHVIRAEEAMVKVAGDPIYTDITRYAAAIEDPSRPAASCDWLDSGRAHIRASLRAGDLISVQTAWYPGWKAVVNGMSRAPTADGIGFILIQPECTGDCDITLEWTGIPDFWPSLLVTIAALAAAGWMIARGFTVR